MVEYARVDEDLQAGCEHFARHFYADLVLVAIVALSAGYQDRQSGTIWVRVGRGADDTVVLSVRDEGRRLPTDFELRSAPGLGMCVLRALSWQLNATIEVRRLDPGTEFVVTASREPKSNFESENAIA